MNILNSISSRMRRTRKLNSIISNPHRTRVFMCVKDEPGVLYRILSILSEINDNNINNNRNDRNFSVNVKHITIETCERFSKLPRARIEAFSREIVSVAHRVRFHSLLEIQKYKNTEEGDVNVKKRDKNEKEFFILAEITACLSGFNLLHNVLDLLDLLGAKESLSNNDMIINKILVFPDPSLTYNPVGSFILNSLNSITNNLNFNYHCPRMGTCPLAHLVGNNLHTLQNQNNHENQNNISLVELKFLRDHGCYTNNTLLEFVFSNRYENRSISDKKEMNLGISALIIEIHYPTEHEELDYIDSIKDKLRKYGFIFTFTGKKLIAFKKHHSCEYYPCYIVRNIRPELQLGD